MKLYNNAVDLILRDDLPKFRVESEDLRIDNGYSNQGRIIIHKTAHSQTELSMAQNLCRESPCQSPRSHDQNIRPAITGSEVGTNGKVPGR